RGAAADARDAPLVVDRLGRRRRRRAAHAARSRGAARPHLAQEDAGRELLPRLLEPDPLAALPRARRPRRHRPALVARLLRGERALRRAGGRGRAAAQPPLGARLPPRLPPRPAPPRRRGPPDRLLPPH